MDQITSKLANMLETPSFTNEQTSMAIEYFFYEQMKKIGKFNCQFCVMGEIQKLCLFYFCNKKYTSQISGCIESSK